MGGRGGCGQALPHPWDRGVARRPGTGPGAPGSPRAEPQGWHRSAVRVRLVRPRPSAPRGAASMQAAPPPPPPRLRLLHCCAWPAAWRTGSARWIAAPPAPKDALKRLPLYFLSGLRLKKRPRRLGSKDGDSDGDGGGKLPARAVGSGRRRPQTAGGRRAAGDRWQTAAESRPRWQTAGRGTTAVAWQWCRRLDMYLRSRMRKGVANPRLGARSCQASPSLCPLWPSGLPARLPLPRACSRAPAFPRPA